MNFNAHIWMWTTNARRSKIDEPVKLYCGSVWSHLYPWMQGVRHPMNGCDEGWKFLLLKSFLLKFQGSYSHLDRHLWKRSQSEWCVTSCKHGTFWHIICRLSGAVWECKMNWVKFFCLLITHPLPLLPVFTMLSFSTAQFTKCTII